MARGEVAPPDPAFVRSSAPARTFTYRLIVVSAGESLTDSDAPRAVADPALERWAREIVNPAHVQVSADHSAADLGLCALDLLAEAAADPDPTDFASYLGVDPVTEHGPDWTPDRLTLAEAWLLARAAAELLSGSRPLLPEDIEVDPRSTSGGVSRLLPIDVERYLRPHRDLSSIANELKGLSHSITEPPTGTIDGLLRRARRYGVRVPSATTANPTLRAELASNEIRLRLDAADREFGKAPPDGLSAALRILFGSIVMGLPQLQAVSPAPATSDLLDQPLAVGAVDVRQWLARYAPVRSRVRSLLDMIQAGEAFDDGWRSGSPRSLTCHRHRRGPVAW